MMDMTCLRAAEAIAQMPQRQIGAEDSVRNLVIIHLWPEAHPSLLLRMIKQEKP